MNFNKIKILTKNEISKLENVDKQVYCQCDACHIEQE